MTLRRYTPHNCPTCGREFHVSDHPKQIYCSWACRPRRSPAERLWSGVLKGDGCWERSSPYHPIKIDGRQTGSHRLSYELACGPIPEGLYVCHRCDNPRCIRPDHLFLGTNRDNQADSVAKGRAATGEANAHSKLTAAQASEIKAEIANGANKTHLAVRYGVSRAAIQAIAKGRNWA